MGATTAQRYKNRRELMVAARAECRIVYADLFGQPLDLADVARWKAWLLRTSATDREALIVIAGLAERLRAVQAFCDSHKPPRVEKRNGIRVEPVVNFTTKTTEMRLFLDPASMPPGIAVAGATAGQPVDTHTIPGTIIPFEYGYGYPLTSVASATPGIVPTSVILSCSSTLASTMYTLFLHGIRAQVDALSTMIEQLVGTRKRPPDWESRVAASLKRLAVVARWDRKYKPGELRKRRAGTRAPPDRLTTSELAAISLICGNEPSISKKKPLLTRLAIDAEAKPIARAMSALAALRAANVPIPRQYG